MNEKEKNKRKLDLIKKTFRENPYIHDEFYVIIKHSDGKQKTVGNVAFGIHDGSLFFFNCLYKQCAPFWYLYKTDHPGTYFFVRDFGLEKIENRFKKNVKIERYLNPIHDE